MTKHTTVVDPGYTTMPKNDKLINAKAQLYRSVFHCILKIVIV